MTLNDMQYTQMMETREYEFYFEVEANKMAYELQLDAEKKKSDSMLKASKEESRRSKQALMTQLNMERFIFILFIFVCGMGYLY